MKKKLIAFGLLTLALSGSSFACPFHHIKKDAVATYKFFSPVTTPIAKALYKAGKYLIT